ncbi:MAG: YihY/virulence factor BrkB family protein [Acidobacteriaceae bacterium]
MPAPGPLTNPIPGPGAVEPQHPQARMIWEYVSLRPLHSLWDLQGVPVSVIAKRTWNSLMNDNLFGSAAELGYWFLFALFPTLVSASSIIGIAMRSASDNYASLLHYMSLVVPPSAYGIVLETFNQITTKSSGGKVTFGLAAALWAASAGFSAIQDSMNAVYKVKETRPYWKVRGSAVLISTLLSLMVTAILASLLAGDFFGRLFARHLASRALEDIAVVVFRIAGWLLAALLLALLFALIYYFAPDLKNKKWRLFTPGAAIGIVGWVVCSIGLRIYLHFFNNYSATYGSLGAVIILLTWFYLSGLMLLLGAEVNSEIEAAAHELKLVGVAPEEMSKEAAGAPPVAASEVKPAA